MWMYFATVLQLKLPVGNIAFTLVHEQTVFMMQFHFDWLPVTESVSYTLTGHFFRYSC